MTILATFGKQPNEIRDYDISYTEYLAARQDSPRLVDPVEVVVQDGLTLDEFFLIDGVVKVFLSGGTDGETYKVTTFMHTEGGRKIEADIKIRVKES